MGRNKKKNTRGDKNLGKTKSKHGGFYCIVYYIWKITKMMTAVTGSSNKGCVVQFCKKKIERVRNMSMCKSG